MKVNKIKYSDVFKYTKTELDEIIQIAKKMEILDKVLQDKYGFTLMKESGELQSNKLKVHG